MIVITYVIIIIDQMIFWMSLYLYDWYNYIIHLTDLLNQMKTIFYYFWWLFMCLDLNV